jgi:uncharacterized protein
MTVIRTYSGIDIPLLAPQTEHIEIRDIAHHLALLNRFCGATDMPISVAQHSVYVARVVAHLKGDPIAQLWGLLHDAHEAYVGDIPRPMRRILGIDCISSTAARLDITITTRFGLHSRLTAEHFDLVKVADDMALAAEWRDQMKGECPIASPAAPFPVKPAPWHKAEEQFLTTFAHLHAAAGLNRFAPTDIIK